MFDTTHFKGLPVGFALSQGGTTATERTVTGIEVHDSLLYVGSFIADVNGYITVANLTAEFAITDEDKIQNVGGTATTNRGLMVIWQKKHPAGL